MIKHIVLWKFLESTEEGSRKENLKQAESLMLKMKEEIPGIKDLRIGMNFTGDSQNSDLALIITFSDKEALQAYQSHPAHERVKEFLARVRYERRLIDFEI